MGMYTYLSNSNDIPITGDSSFVWQCITFLLGQDLIVYTSVGLGLILIYGLISSIIKYKED